MTLADKLAAHIAAEQAEIARIKADGITNVQAANQRIALLQQAQTVLTNNPGVEGLITGLHQMGIEL